MKIDELMKMFVGDNSENIYLKKYFDIINFRQKKENKLSKTKYLKTKNKDLYCERHHIIPKFWFKVHNLDIINKNNIVCLTVKEHIYAHWWLYMFYMSLNPDSRIAFLACLPIMIVGKMCRWKETMRNLTIDDVDVAVAIRENFIKYHMVHKYKLTSEQVSERMIELLSKTKRMFDKDTGQVRYIPNDMIQEYEKRGYLLEKEYTKYKTRQLYDDIINHRIEIPKDVTQRELFIHKSIDRIYKHIKGELTETQKDLLFIALKGKKRHKTRYTKEQLEFIKNNPLEEVRKHFKPSSYTHLRAIRREMGINDTYSEKCSWYYHPITDEEREFYKTHTVNECMEKFNRSRSTVIDEQKKLGVFVSSKDPEYSKEDDKYIINHTTYECVEHFPNRTYEALAQRKRAITPPELFKKQKLQDMKIKPRFSGLVRVDQYTTDGQFIRTFDSITEAQKTLNIKHISSVISGKRKTSGGFVWKRHIEA